MGDRQRIPVQAVEAWLQPRKERIEIFYLPAIRPS